MSRTSGLTFVSAMKTPLGWLEIEADDDALLKVHFVSHRPRATDENDLIREARKQLDEYFEGKRKAFKLPLRLQGTLFQKKVWSALAEIPYGELRSYGDLAKRIGHEGASRAVGSALGKNRLPILLPCHRIVAGNGIGGFTGGLRLKKFLLKHEGVEV